MTAVRFQSGGTLREGSFYVERRADRELPAALEAGELCYVLAPRQMGKSSLRARAEATLRTKGTHAVGVDLTALGTTGITPQQWYFGIIDELARQLDLDDPVEFWERNGLLSPVRRFSRFLRAEVLARHEAPVVIFFDEIDVVRSLPFSSDDFFAAIRAMYNARVDDAELRRLAFCIMGVATPHELMQDTNRTPFNVGRGIRLEDFTRQEASSLLPGLAQHNEDPWSRLDAVLEWTHGHPYMTQRICEAIAKEGESEGLPGRVHVARLVGSLFLTRGRVEDLNLAAVERFFARHGTEPLAMKMLDLYARLLADQRVLAVSDDAVQTALRLSGMAAERDDGASVWLRPRNPIFTSVFDETWVIERMAHLTSSWRD